MSPSSHARNLADLAADALSRLAEDLDAIAGLDLSAAPGHERGRAESTVSESRRMAAWALERLAPTLPLIPADGEEDSLQTQAWAEKALVKYNATAGECRRWAAAWRAFADAPEVGA